MERCQHWASRLGGIVSSIRPRKELLRQLRPAVRPATHQLTVHFGALHPSRMASQSALAERGNTMQMLPNFHDRSCLRCCASASSMTAEHRTPSSAAAAGQPRNLAPQHQTQNSDAYQPQKRRGVPVYVMLPLDTVSTVCCKVAPVSCVVL